MVTATFSQLKVDGKLKFYKMRPRFETDQTYLGHSHYNEVIQCDANTVNVYLKRDVARFS